MGKSVYYRHSARDLLMKSAMSQQNPEALRAQLDFNYFYWYMTQDRTEPYEPFAHMDLWTEHLITEKSNRVLYRIAGQNTDILAPRGGGKSTYLGLWNAWVIGIHTVQKRFLPQLFISYVIDVARNKSAVIKNIVESKRYREVFPCVVPGKKWGDEEWSIDYAFAGIDVIGQDAYTISCAGLKGAIVSKRAGLIILDDIIKSPDDIENPDIREKMVRNWQSCAEFCLWEGGRAVCLGTRFRGDDIHVTTFIAPKWIQIEQSALIEDEDGTERSYCPELHSLALLKEERETKPIDFSFQRQNKVVRVASISIDPAWIGHREPLDDITQYDSLVIGADLSSKLKEKNDYSVFCFGGRKGNRFDILDMRRGRWAGNIEKLDVMLEMLIDWGILDWKEHDEHRIRQLEQLIGRIGGGTGGKFNRVRGELSQLGVSVYFYCEDVQYQGSLAGDFQTYILDELGLSDLVYRPSPAKVDKLMRLRSVSGLYENRLVGFNQWRSLGPMVRELTLFGTEPFDDAMDANVHCLLGLRGLSPLDAV